MISRRGVSFLMQLRGLKMSLFREPLAKNNFFLSNSMLSSGVCGEGNLKFSQSQEIQNGFSAQERQKYEDTFGNLEGFEVKFQKTRDDPEDIKECRREKTAQGKTMKQYQEEIREHLRNHDYKSALKTLEVDMMNDKKNANSYIYRLLVSYNAKIGDVNEAYRLYINFKKKQGKVCGKMYTSLFEGCANCKNSNIALDMANTIRDFLKNDKVHKANILNYNAMLKAYGRHGDLTSALKIFDEVMEKRDKVRVETYCFLFQACISDKNSGLRQALIVWRKMLQNRVKPTVFVFNLLLRCVRECSFGETQLIHDLVKQIQMESEHFYKRKVVYKTVDNNTKKCVLKIPVGESYLIKEKNENLSERLSTEEKRMENEVTAKLGKENSEFNFIFSQSTNNLVSTSEERNSGLPGDPIRTGSGYPTLPNLLALKPNLGSVISFKAMTTPHDRFKFFGDVEGFLKVMSQFGVCPDIKTFTLLLDVVTPTAEAEKEIISKTQDYKVKLDAGFFNVLIKRRNLRGEYVSVRDVLTLMQRKGVNPDIITFGTLALGCTSRATGLCLIETAHLFGIRLNVQILGALLWNARLNRDLKYVKAILQAAKEDETKLYSKFVSALGNFVREEMRARAKNLRIGAQEFREEDKLGNNTEFSSSKIEDNNER